MKPIPEAPGGLPLLGHAPSWFRDPLTFLESLPDHDLVGLRFGTRKVILIRDPELTRQALVDDRIFDRADWMDRLRDAVGDGLVVCPYSRHRRDRRLVQPAFHPSRLAGYARTMTNQAAAVTQSWHHGLEFDATTEMVGLTMRSLLQAMFSAALSPQAMHQTTADLHTFSKGSIPLTLLPTVLTRLPLPGLRRHRQASLRGRETARSILAERRASGTDHGDLLSALMSARIPGQDGDAQGLTDEQIVDQLISFYGAGTDTTACLLAWALYLLAQHPDIEARIYTEVDTVLAGAPAGLEHLPQLPLTGHVLTEVLRMYPPGWILPPRTATADTHLGSYPIPAGTDLLLSPYLIHRRSDLYEEPTRFDPDRWDNALRTPPPRRAFIPHGAGARKCIAEQFSMVNAAIALATIVSRWRLTPDPAWRFRHRMALTSSPRGLRMRVTTRSA
jgi:pentalenene oxygenase